MLDGSLVHMLAGGIGGTVGAVLTCPLEVLKVRLQSSQKKVSGPLTTLVRAGRPRTTDGPQKRYSFFTRRFRVTIRLYILYIIKNEGIRALYKGLMPTLVGVLPSRAIYFSTYHNGQNFFGEYFGPESHMVYLCSAAVGGFVGSTCTNPIWFVKTRLQLDHGALEHEKLTVRKIIVNTWKQFGIRGFYKGITASYVGISETALNYLIYETVKIKLINWGHSGKKSQGSFGSKLHQISDTFYIFIASLISKSIATTLAYPHEVARTRLREDCNKHRNFIQTLFDVVKENGYRGLYRGLATHYARQVPNSVFMIGTYEGFVFMMQSWGYADHE